ncbi:MAG: conjugal transfer protein [Streptococcaceae bacterium]|jgi:hypothetical protein|nr:conjugal transfer protein [Streptococcaceae bacterium]
MKREPYNYTSLFTEPMKTRYFGNWLRLPFLIALTDMITMGVTFLFLLAFFRKGIAGLGEVWSAIPFGIYMGIPYLSMLAINKIRPEGKKIHFYLYDSLVFLLQWKFPKKRVSQGKVVNNQLVTHKNRFY